MTDSETGERLQKVLAAAGVGSRRDCEELIREGRVEVDRRVVTELGFRVDPDKHEIRVDGELVRIAHRVYYAVNKPQGVVSTNADPSGRPRVIDLVPPHKHLFTVGRLDRSSEGLILVTNDGELANQLAHPRYGVPKTYRVEVAGHPTPEELDQLTRGIHLAEGKVQASEVHLKKRLKQSTLLEIVLREGRNREIRRMLARLGHKVLRLKRIALGPLKLGDIPVGGYRKLQRLEVAALRNIASGKPTSGRKAGDTPKSRETLLRKKRRPTAASRSLGKVLSPESNDFVDFLETPTKQKAATQRVSTGVTRGKTGRAAGQGRRPSNPPRRKKRPR